MKYQQFFRKAYTVAFLTVLFLLVFLQAGTVSAQVPIVTPKPAEPEKPAPVLRSKETDDKGNTREYLYISTVGVGQFTEEINKLGKKGYRLQNVTISSPVGGAVASETPAGRFSHLALAAIFRLDKPNGYEYEWFEAEIPGEIVTRLNKRAESGFYYGHSVFFSDNGFCDGPGDSSDPLDAVLALVCGSEGGIYFVERKNGETAKREYRVHIGRFGWGKNPTAELQAALDNSGQIGFRPVALGKMHTGLKYAFYTIVEKDKGVEGEPIKTQYRFLKSEFGFSKKANAITREGFRIKFGSQFGAFENMLFEKTDGPVVPTTYRWVDASGASHEKELAEALSGGALYALANRAAEDLIFEDTPGQKYEYKILRMTPEVIKPTKKNPNPPPTKTQDEIFGEFDALLAEGYVIRDVFYSAGTKVLFERKK